MGITEVVKIHFRGVDELTGTANKVRQSIDNLNRPMNIYGKIANETGRSINDVNNILRKNGFYFDQNVDKIRNSSGQFAKYNDISMKTIRK